jgi:hypothetical protein
MKLTIELVPSTAWYSNVRSNVTPAEWDVLRKECYKKAGYKCEVCGGKGPNHPVECHEIWEYDDGDCTQTLGGLIALCPDCHSTKHFGFARVSGKEKEAKLHLMKVNDLTEEQADKYIEEVFMIWEERSKYDWTLDISFLNKDE